MKTRLCLFVLLRLSFPASCAFLLHSPKQMQVQMSNYLKTYCQQKCEQAAQTGSGRGRGEQGLWAVQTISSSRYKSHRLSRNTLTTFCSHLLFRNIIFIVYCNNFKSCKDILKIENGRLQGTLQGIPYISDCNYILSTQSALAKTHKDAIMPIKIY